MSCSSVSATTDIALPGPAWKLEEILQSNGSAISDAWKEGSRPITFIVYTYATFRTNETLWIYKSRTGGAAPYMAFLRQAKVDKDVTDRLTQERWDEIYCKAIAGQALLGRKPEIIEQIF